MTSARARSSSLIIISFCVTYSKLLVKYGFMVAFMLSPVNSVSNTYGQSLDLNLRSHIRYTDCVENSPVLNKQCLMADKVLGLRLGN